jgi:hypothetical protein
MEGRCARRARRARRQAMVVPYFRNDRCSRSKVQQVTSVSFTFRASVQLASSATQLYDVVQLCRGNGMVQVTSMDVSAFTGVATLTHKRLREVGYGKIHVTDAAITTLMASMGCSGIGCAPIPGLLSYRPMSVAERDGRDDPIIFFNSSRALSPTHHDPLDAVLLVLAGSKTLYIAPPHASDGVSLTGNYMAAFANLVDDPYQGTAQHSSLWSELVLNAGDGAFIPAGMPSLMHLHIAWLTT